MFNPRMFENSRPDGFPVLEIVAPEPAQEGMPEPPRLFVPLRRTDLAGEVSGPVAAMRLTQRFRFGSEQSTRPIEAAYRFPLPGDAAVTGVRVRFGMSVIQATLAERESAEHEYQAAREEGRQAALLTRESPDVFTLQVSGIKPDEDVTIETSYAQLARPEGAGWTLRVPLTTAPRYARGDERGSPHASGQPLALLRDPGHRFTLDLTFEAAENVASPTHTLDVQAGEGRVRVRLRDGEVLPDRDCVLTWQPRQEATRPTLQVLRHQDSASGATCFLALVTPPAEASAAGTVPREVILLIDHSGSMEGPKWQAADWAVQNLLAGLTPADTFNLGLFHNATRWFSKRPVRADERTLRQARDFLLQHRDSGGTELGVALEQALGQARDDEGRARHVLVVTDAEVSDAGRILALVEREAERTDRRRVDVLCIDAAPNSGLAQELAERGGGLARFLTSDPAENDIATALDEVLLDWAAPVYRDLSLEIAAADVQAAGRRVRGDGYGRSSIDLGSLPAGRPVWVAGRVQQGRGETAHGFRLLSAGQELTREEPDTAGATIPPTRPAIAALFGARRVLDLEMIQSSAVSVAERLRQLGYDPAEVLKASSQGSAIYAENARAEATDALHGLLVKEALQYGITCSATAFVATRQEAGEKVAGTVVVANALPHGWSPGFLSGQAYGVPATMMRMAMASPMATGGYGAAPGGAYGAPMPTMAPPPMPTGAAPPPAPGSGGHGVDLSSLAEAPLDAARELFQRFSRALPGRASGHQPRARAAATQRVTSGPSVLFAGTPRFSGREAVLFDSATQSWGLPGGNALTLLALRFLDGTPGGSLDGGLALLLYVDDLAQPRARVRLADLVRQGGERPLNVKYRPGQVVRLVLVDQNGAWAAMAPRIEVALG